MLFSLPARRAGLEVEKTAHAVIVMDTERDYVHSLSERAATVLEQCDGTHTCAEIAQIVSAQTRVPYERIAGEVAHLVAAFADMALLQSA
jgi:hypothetical protein